YSLNPLRERAKANPVRAILANLRLGVHVAFITLIRTLEIKRRTFSRRRLVMRPAWRWMIWWTIGLEYLGPKWTGSQQDKIELTAWVNKRVTALSDMQPKPALLLSLLLFSLADGALGQSSEPRKPDAGPNVVREFVRGQWRLSDDMMIRITGR